RKLADDHPAVVHIRSRLAASHTNLAILMEETGEPVKAAAEYRAALALYRKLADDDPKLPGHRDRAANMNNNLSLVLRRLGRPAEARDHAERAVAAREELIKAEPEAAYRGDLAENYLNRGLSRRALGDLAGAASDVHRALGLWNALPSWRVEEWFE